MKYIPGEITGTMSGSIGAKTASHNKSGAYFRTKSTPTNPNTVRQQAIRSIFGALVNHWTTTLTAAERAQWEAYAAAVPMTDKLGQTIYLSGQNHFIRSNSVRLQIGEAIIEAGPSSMNTGEPVTSIEVNTDGTANTIGVSAAETDWATKFNLASPASNNGDIAIYVGPAIPSGWTFYKGPYQLVGAATLASAASSASFTTVFTSCLNANGNPEDGQYRGLRAVVMYDDGRLSQPYALIAPVAVDSV